MTIAYLNGEFIPKDEAKVSVLDRGFIFADGIYEVMPAYNRIIFRLDEHLLRLQNSLDAIHIKNPHTHDEWKSIMEQLVARNDAQDQSLYLQITRGVAERDHVFSDNMVPTVFAMSRPLVKKDSHQGVKAITTEDIRWKFCDIKSIALLPGVLLRYEAHQQGAYEAILIRDGFLTEGAASNVFIVKGDTVATPPKDHKVLPGITRNLTVELLQKNNIAIEERMIAEAELHDADEIWITSSTQEIVPVVSLNGNAVGEGSVGAMWHTANTIYQNFKRDYHGEDL